MRLPQKLVLPALAATAVLALSACADRYYDGHTAYNYGYYGNGYYGSTAYNVPGTYDTTNYSGYYGRTAYNNGYYGPAGYNGYGTPGYYNRYGLRANNCGWPTWPCVDMLSGVVVIDGMYYANLPYRDGGYGAYGGYAPYRDGYYGREFLLNGTWRKADLARPRPTG